MMEAKDRYNISTGARVTTFFSDYGMLVILVLLCVLFSVLTMREQTPTGAEAAGALRKSLSEGGATGPVLVIIPASKEDSAFAQGVVEDLSRQQRRVSLVSGDPAAIRSALDSMGADLEACSTIVTTVSYAGIVRNFGAQFPSLARATFVTPQPYRWPTFLLANNLRNVANQITVIAIIAIAMTMVIITAGIDLSVGSLIALSAVVTAWLVGKLGGDLVTSGGVAIAVVGALAVCGATGAFSGLMITAFRIPPFIATLAMMQVAAGVAYIISEGKPIYRLPGGFVWLGRGVDPILHVPIAVILMFVLYIIAHILMSRTALGRYIYAVGGNAEAARLAGIRVNGILMFVYTLSGILAGLGGIVMASQLKSGAPTYGLTYELYVIAAVVVGGTSLSGGEGRIFGTLIGAFIIGVIQNGMNLTNVETYTQKVVLGLVILIAVLLDRLKQRGFMRRKMAAQAVVVEEEKIHTHS